MQFLKYLEEFSSQETNQGHFKNQHGLSIQKKSLISKEDILKKIKLRNNARENKDYNEADKIRDELLEKGVLIEDKDGKTSWKIK